MLHPRYPRLGGHRSPPVWTAVDEAPVSLHSYHADFSAEPGQSHGPTQCFVPSDTSARTRPTPPPPPTPPNPQPLHLQCPLNGTGRGPLYLSSSCPRITNGHFQEPLYSFRTAGAVIHFQVQLYFLQVRSSDEQQCDLYPQPRVFKCPAKEKAQLHLCPLSLLLVGRWLEVPGRV